MQEIVLDAQMPELQIVEGESIRIVLPEPPRRYYQHGWQSWSLAAWVEMERSLTVPKPWRLHPMQHDPAHITRTGWNGSWVGAVETSEGKVLLLGALGLDAHVVLEGNALSGAYAAGSGAWLIAHVDETEAFGHYARELGRRLGSRMVQQAPRVWCSWYGAYTAIDEQLLNRTFDELGDLPFDVLQVDDGWQVTAGDWEANARFPQGMQTLAHKIKATGRRAGIWLAPLIATRSSDLFRRHGDWFLRDKRGRLVSAGYNWGSDLFALDTTHPLVIQWLRQIMQKTRAWGYDYLKLDFLYGGALPGKRHVDMPREVAYRAALQLMREAMGEDAYFLACGAPIVPSLGICDALRVGPDVAAQWISDRDERLLHNPTTPGARNALRTTVYRLWLKPIVRPDPDVAYFRTVHCGLSDEQKRLLQDMAHICGFRATSDLPQWLTEDECGKLQEFLLAEPEIRQVGALSYTIDGREVDFTSITALPDAPTGWRKLLDAPIGWAANRRLVLWINDRVGRRRSEKRMKDLR